MMILKPLAEPSPDTGGGVNERAPSPRALPWSSIALTRSVMPRAVQRRIAAFVELVERDEELAEVRAVGVERERLAGDLR